MAHQTEDDGFHEIQLNGKQLVFLFMAATVVSVVIFLCGVLVGRGVRAERTSAEAAAAPVDPTAPVPAPPAAAAQPPATSNNDPTTAQPPTPAAEGEARGLSYAERLEDKKPVKEQLARAPSPDEAHPPAKSTPPPAKPAPAPPAKAAPSQTAPPPPSAPAAAASSPAGESGVFTVQIAALNARGEADAIVHRLTNKGYQAYVVPPGNGAAMYRVRVGKFKTRREAEPTASKLQKEEQFKPWITR